MDNHVVPKCAADWWHLGKLLGLEEHLLKIIKENFKDCEECCSKMLNDWLDLNPNASWKILIDAVTKLPDATVGEEIIL